MAHLIYYNMMTPKWLKDRNRTNKVDWRCDPSPKFEDLRVQVSGDSSNYETVCVIPLLAGKDLAQTTSDITVRINVGLELPETKQFTSGKLDVFDMPTKPTDPIAIMLSDTKQGIGMVIQDVSQGHDKPGPYYGIEAEIGPNGLKNEEVDNLGQQLVRTSSKNNPDEFRLTFKPSEYWGEAYSAIDGGHKMAVQFNTALDVKKGLNLQICRVDRNGEFKINYLEVSIFAGSKAP